MEKLINKIRKNMTIKNINAIQNYIIICNNVEEVKDCFEMLEKLGLKVCDFRRKDFFTCAERDLIVDCYGGIFKNHHSLDLSMSCNKTAISFNDFKNQTKSLKPIAPVVQDIEYNKEDGRITKINRITKKPIYTIEDNCIEAGLYFISEETRDKARKKLVIETKLKNVASRLNNGIEIDWNNWEQKKIFYYI